MIKHKVSGFGKTFRTSTALMLVLAGLVFSSATPAVAAPSRNFNPLIIGGYAASTPYPGMASLQIDVVGEPNFHLCGASLVSGRYVVTNAHCVTNIDGSALDPRLFHLRIGSHNRLDGGVNVGVSEILPHTDWDWGMGDNPVADIALLRLDEYVQLQPFEVAPYLAQSNAVTRLLGWGSTEPSGEGPAPLNLQEIETKLVQPQKCAEAGITAGEICVHSPYGTDGPCFGDSGGPALQKVTSSRWSVVGSTSRSVADWCGVGETVYTDLTYYRQWMYQVMRNGAVPAPVTRTHPTDKSGHYNWALPVQPGAIHNQR